MPYKDKALQKETTRNRVRRYREKKALQGVTPEVIPESEYTAPDSEYTSPDSGYIAPDSSTFTPAPKPVRPPKKRGAIWR